MNNDDHAISVFINENIQKGITKLNALDVYRNLNTESEWSIIIKTHSLIEASLNGLLAKQIGEDASEVIEKIMIGGRAGKLELARRLKLLGESAINFIESLSTIRNRCVHNGKGLNLTVGIYLDSLEQSTKYQFVSKIQTFRDAIIVGDLEVDLRTNSKEILIYSSKIVIAECTAMEEIVELRKIVKTRTLQKDELA